MNQKLFFIINGIVLAVILLMYVNRKKPTESKFNLSSSGKKLPPPEILDLPNEMGPRERVINVVFNYNGHSWDAFEVLGLPAGSPMSEVEKAYDRLSKAHKGPEIDFYLAAVQAIRKS